MMKDKMTETVDALLGFDSDELQRRMTDGLAEWMHRRKEAAHTRKLCLPVLCTVLLAASATYYATPVLDYCLGDGMTYEAAPAKTGKMLGL